MNKTIELPAMRRAAELAPNSANKDARTIEVVWSTGARVRRSPFFGDPYDEELSLDPDHVRLERLNSGAPFLKVHETGELDAVIGSVVPETVRIENGKGIATIRISEREDVEPIWQDIQAGHIRAVSIGYQVHRFEVSKPEGSREVWRAVDWTPFEISAVPVGADPAAGFRSIEELHDCVVHRSDDTPTNKRNMTMPNTQTRNDDATVATKKTRPSAPSETSFPGATTNPPSLPQETVDEKRDLNLDAKNTTSVQDTDALVSQTRDAERERVSTIYDLASKLDLERSFADDLVKRGVTLDESRRVILDQVATKTEETRTFSHVSMPLGGQDETVTRRDGVTSALLHRYSPTLFSLEDAARQYRGMTLMELARESLGNTGVNTRGLSRDEVATRALNSTSDFPEILQRLPTKRCDRLTIPILEPSHCSAGKYWLQTLKPCTGCNWAKPLSC